VNYFNFTNPVDVNNDNFTDVTQQQRISLFSKFDFQRPNERLASLGARYVYEDRWGGELQWSKDKRGSDQIYAESIYTNRVEILGNYELPVTRQKIIFDYSYNYHLQDSYYGTNKFLADQHVAFAQLRWDKKIGRHDLLAGLPFRYIYYDDNTVGTQSGDSTSISNFPMHTYLPGIFLQDEFKATDQLTILTGLRYDRHNQHGSIFSPRLSFKFSPDKSNTLRLSAGNGFRVVNLFTEDHAALTGSRSVVIKNELKPEQSWNVNLNYATSIVHDAGFVGVDASVFYTYFTNKIVGDFLSDPDAIIYDNLLGHAISKGVTLNTELAFTNSLKIIAGITFMDVYQRDISRGEDRKIPQLFAPKVSGTYAVSYSLDRIGLTFDVTGRFNGPMKLPVGPPEIDPRPAQSPWFRIMNVQAGKSFTNGIEIYGGVKNVFNFFPKNPLLEPENPFGQNFDTSYNYSSVQGVKGFLGIRYTMQ
jgi:outer membrane receptor for ferrienterochelin and colicins